MPISKSVIGALRGPVCNFNKRAPEKTRLRSRLENVLLHTGPWLCLALLECMAARTASAQNWQLVWSDEFNGVIGPDWTYEIGNGTYGWGNNEKEYYQPQNATIQNGMLAITAKNESVAGLPYTSARMKTDGHQAWLYGKIVARIKLPAFTGEWPAFWMLGSNFDTVGWPECGEIDIMEQINSDFSTHGSTHWWVNPAPLPQWWTSGSEADWTSSTGVDVTQFHTYSLEWDSQYMKWFVDGVNYSQFYIGGNSGGTNAFNTNQFFLILNMAVGGNWPGFNINNSALPAQMLVDYVRVYQDVKGSSVQANSKTPFFIVVNKASGKSLCLTNGNASNGAPINQFSYNYDDPNQLWAIQPTENGDHFQIVSYVSGRSASIAQNSTGGGAALVDSDYTGYDPSQQFDLLIPAMAGSKFAMPPADWCWTT